MLKRTPLTCISFSLDDLQLEVDEEQLTKLNKWLVGVIKRIDEKHSAQGRALVADAIKQQGYVYAGAIGGNFTFEFTPTGVGIVFRVRESITGEAIDLSDYENW